jgi:hypothetical protein
LWQNRTRHLDKFALARRSFAGAKQRAAAQAGRASNGDFLNACRARKLDCVYGFASAAAMQVGTAVALQVWRMPATEGRGERLATRHFLVLKPK